MPFTSLLLTLVLSPAPADGSWPQFLGPHGMARAGDTSVSLTFDREQDVLWRTDLPHGSSSPCIVGSSIFVTGTEDDYLHMLALDRTTGAELWRKSVKTPGLGPKAHVDAAPAAPTACSDGERVVFYFGGYGLLAYDLEGTLLWEKQLPVPGAPFGIGTSPVIVDDDVILSRDGCDDSSIYAFSKIDGTERWRVPRLGYKDSHSTPFVWNNAGRRELIVAGTQRLTALDPSDGSELWQISGLTSLVCTTPTADENTLYFAGWSTPDAESTERKQRLLWSRVHR